MNNEQKNLMRSLQAADFALIETILFLDAHPTNKKAMDFYKTTKTKRDMLRSKYTSQFGPLTADTVEGDRWTWTDDPWPWHVDREG